MSTFRINAKNFFLTYPHCDGPLEDFIWAADKYIVARELHTDGTPHIHCFLAYETKKNIRSPQHFNYQGHQCNIQSARSPSNVMAYVTKGATYITNFTDEELKKGRNEGKRTSLFRALIEAEKIDKKFIVENPDVLGLNYNSIMSWLELCKTKVRPPYPSSKQRHVWVYGPPNSGKTTWFRGWRDGKNCFNMPRNNDWKGLSEEYTYFYSDEYKGHLTVQSLNEICDGDCKLNTKGGSTHVWFPTVIILSNFTIRECYKKCDEVEWEALEARFMEYEAPHELGTINI